MKYFPLQYDEYEIRFFDVPKNLSPHTVYMALRRFGRINDIDIDETAEPSEALEPSESSEPSEPSERIDCTVDMHSSSPAELKRKCELFAEQLCCSMRWRYDHEHSEDEQNHPDDDSNGNQSIMAMVNAPDLLTPPDQQSNNHILNALNDDCLQAIFESPAMDIWDLLQLANVCKRFNTIAKQAFRTVYDENESHAGIELWRMEQLLKTFGDSIKSIDLSVFFSSRDDTVVPMLVEHCKNIINLECDVDHEQTLIAMRSMMPQLRQLNITTKSNNFALLFEPNTAYALETLHVKCEKLDDFPVLPSPLPFLTHFSLSPVYESHQISNVTFFAAHPQLKTLELSYCDFDLSIDQLLGHLPNLEDLYLGLSEFSSEAAETFACFGQLKHLKHLNCVFSSDTPVLAILNAFTTPVRSNTRTSPFGNQFFLEIDLDPRDP